MPVLKDLIPDLSGLYAQYALIEPWLQTDQPSPDRISTPANVSTGSRIRSGFTAATRS